MFARLLGLICVLSGSAFDSFGETPSTAPLWDSAVPVPGVAELCPLKNVEFLQIQAPERRGDTVDWLHGVALAWHAGRLYASYGYNEGVENTAGELTRGRYSLDHGKTWSAPFAVARGGSPDAATSHGVFLRNGKALWAFVGAFTGERQNVHTRAFLMDEKTGTWLDKGVVLRDGFWSLNEPQQMKDGNWIMPGVQVGGPWGSPNNPPAVAISHGNDFSRWDLVVIPKDPKLVIWGESGVIAEGPRITCIARGWSGSAWAFVSVSDDFGRTWSMLAQSNLPMNTSKPCCGLLSTGQRYLIATTAADTAGAGDARHPLTIAVSRPGKRLFSAVFRIRNDVFPEGPGESVPNAALSYPYATEYKGRLYVGYSNDGARGKNLNSAELAVIPVASLALP